MTEGETSVYSLQGFWRFSRYLLAYLPLFAFSMLVFVIGRVSKGMGLTDVFSLLPLETKIALLLMLIIALFMAYILLKDMQVNTIELRSEGLYYRQLGFCVFVSWHQVKGIKRRFLSPLLELHSQPGRCSGPLAFILRYTPAASVFPLSPFVHSWQTSQLRQDLKHFLPHLDV